MTESPARILSQDLIDQGFGTDPIDDADWPIFVSSIPDGSDVQSNAMSVNDTSPERQFRLISGEGSKWSWGFQILLRADYYPVGWSKLKTISEYLDQYNTKDIIIDDQGVDETYRIQDVKVLTPVLSAGPEEGTDRQFFSLNGEIWF